MPPHQKCQFQKLFYMEGTDIIDNYIKIDENKREEIGIDEDKSYHQYPHQLYEYEMQRR